MVHLREASQIVFGIVCCLDYFPSMAIKVISYFTMRDNLRVFYFDRQFF